MKDNRAFILREDKAEEFLRKSKNNPGKQKTKLLGEELRTVRDGITDEKVLTGFNMAIAICNKYLVESEDKRGIVCSHKGRKVRISMADRMEFPETFEKFAEQYGFIDVEEIYTNASWLIPVNRVKQWLDHKTCKERRETNE